MDTQLSSSAQLRESFSQQLLAHPALPEKYMVDRSELSGLIDKLDQVSELSARQTGAMQFVAHQLLDQSLEYVSTQMGTQELVNCLRAYVTQRSSIPEIVRASNSPDIYICHSTQDKAPARQLAEELSRHGYPVWLKGWEMRSHDSLHEKLTQISSLSYWFILVLSPAAVEQDWCKFDLRSLLSEHGQERGIILPVLIRNCRVPATLRDLPQVDCRGKLFSQGVHSILSNLSSREASIA
jgi:hypothetical protein